MKITNIKFLYRYENEDNSISITPNPRNIEGLVYGYRLIADEGYELYYNNINQSTNVIDVKNIEGWTQEEMVEEPELEEK